MKIDPERHARALAEKNRLDPPPGGKEWSLGYDHAGRRAPANDLLVDLGGELVADPIDYGTDEHGIRPEVVQAVMEAWADVARRGADPEYQDSPTDTAAGVMLATWAPRDVAQVAAMAVATHLANLNGTPADQPS